MNTTIFIAYSSKDEEYLNELRVHLEPLKLYEIVDDIWFDGKIVAGQSWEEEIRKQLDTASIILLMLSPDFLFSDYCRNEMIHALERHEKEEATVIPIIARPCSWKLNPNLRAIEAAIKSRIISKAASRDECYVEITESLAEIAQKKKRDAELARLQAQEDEYWKKIQAENTISAYRQYLKTYPNGDYIKTAEKAIRKIEAEQEKARLMKLQAQETAFWEKIEAKNTLADYQKYLEKYPNGKYAADALEAIETIKQKELDAAKARDNKAWQAAQAENSKEAYQDYITRFPNGLHKATAKTAIQKLTLLIPEMVFVKGGTYKDQLIKDFHIGKYPVTNEEYAFFLNHYGSDVMKAGDFKGQKMVEEDQWSLRKVSEVWQAQKGYERHLIIHVSWYGAKEYCNWLKGETGENYALPSEWYWEYAASGGQKSKGFQYAGSNDIEEVAWYRKNSYDKGENHPDYGTHQVGQKAPNELNLYDMSGNVWEWCEEVWENKKDVRVIRGGSWSFIDNYCRVSDRFRSYTDVRYYNTGFRLAR